MGRKHCGKRKNCSLRAIYPFPKVFSKGLCWRHVKTRACLGKGLMEVFVYHFHSEALLKFTNSNERSKALLRNFSDTPACNTKGCLQKKKII